MGRFSTGICQREPSYVNLVIKFVLFSVNMIFLFMSISLIAVASYATSLKEKPIRDALDFFLDPACWMNFIGCMMIVISFIGCFGSLRENTMMIQMYYWILRVLMLLQTLSGILMIVINTFPSVRNVFGMNRASILHDGIQRYRDDEDLKNFIDLLQIRLKCCGVGPFEYTASGGYMDWNNNAYFACKKSSPSNEKCSVPHSCCILDKKESRNLMCGQGVLNKTYFEVKHKIYTIGCLTKISKWINLNSIMFSCILLVLILPQIVLMLLAQKLKGQIEMQKSRQIPYTMESSPVTLNKPPPKSRSPSPRPGKTSPHPKARRP